MSAAVALRGLVKSYGEGAVVADLDLDVPAGALVALLGPSGCGKTTTMKCVAGLLEPTAGEISFDGESVLGVPPERREAAMVFQQPLLFPHMSAGQNVAFGLRMRRLRRAEVRDRVAAMLARVRLEGLEDRRAAELSGGQAQRVALARALVVSPRVLLLDEPLSQLDANLRVEMRDLVRRIQREVGVTTLFVTHDQEEAVTLADTVALMLDGRLEQVDAPQGFYERPATARVARFFGCENLLPGRVDGGVFDGPLGRVPAASGAVSDGPALLAVRQESVRVLDDRAAARAAETGPVREGTVADAVYLGTALRLRVDVGGLDLHAVADPTARLVPGDRVTLHVPADRCHVVPAE